MGEYLDVGLQNSILPFTLLISSVAVGLYALLGFVLILSIYLGLELISKVPSTLHTPLMSGANAISGIALVGALVLSTDSNLQSAIAFLAVLFASINVFGGYLVTNRMLKMFKKK